MSCHVLCAHTDPAIADRLAALFESLVPGVVSVESFDNGRQLSERAEALSNDGDDLPLILASIELKELDGLHLLQELHERTPLRGTRKVILASAGESAGTDRLLGQGALHGRLEPDFDSNSLDRLLRPLLTDYVVHTAPHLIDDLHPLLDLRSLAAAFSSARDNLHQLDQRLHDIERTVISFDRMSDDKVEEAMITEFDRLIERPQRRTYAPGDTLVKEGDAPGTIWIILSGRVKLYRTIEGENVTFHSESAGRIVGLMSLSLQDPIFFSCQAVTETTAMILRRSEVSDAIHRSPALSNYLITVILRSMARRNRRSAQLLVKVKTLNRRLADQRDELSRTLEELRATQQQLVDTTKMATLGNLAAGMAHELNNPVAAILHASDHLESDLTNLLGLTKDLAIASAAIPATSALPARSTREERQLRNQLAKDLEIEPYDATKLVQAGVSSQADFQRYLDLCPTTDEAAAIEQLNHSGQIGSALRNISNCSTRIAALVRSLKVYARADDEHFEKIMLDRTLEDVLLILANKLRGVEVEKHYAELPEIQANASQLQQVWTNLISNAAQATGSKGRVRISTSSPRANWQRVEIEDNGSGIPEEARAHLFEARFTTRSGRVEFGLGLGLPISQNIIQKHGGEIRFESEPGRTVFIVDLPLTPPQTPQAIQPS